MPGTLQGLLVVILAVLPGAIYLWGFEREAGKWRIGVSDAVLRLVAASVAVGTAAGRAVHSEKRWVQPFARAMAGKDPAPRAWDSLFASKPSGTVRVRLRGGDWIGGAFGADSYAAGYPEQPQDLLLERAYQMRDDGSFLRDEAGGFVDVGSRLLVGWDEMSFIEFFPAPENENETP